MEVHLHVHGVPYNTKRQILLVFHKGIQVSLEGESSSLSEVT